MYLVCALDNVVVQAEHQGHVMGSTFAHDVDEWMKSGRNVEPFWDYPCTMPLFENGLLQFEMNLDGITDDPYMAFQGRRIFWRKFICTYRRYINDKRRSKAVIFRIHNSMREPHRKSGMLQKRCQVLAWLKFHR